LSEVAAIQFELLDLLARNCAANLGRLCVHLGDVFAGDDHFLSNHPNHQRHVHARFLRHFQNEVLRFKFLEALAMTAMLYVPEGSEEAT